MRIVRRAGAARHFRCRSLRRQLPRRYGVDRAPARGFGPVPDADRRAALPAREVSCRMSPTGAMDLAADWLAAHGDGDGVLLTTDADSRVAPNWVSANLGAIAAGVDGVAGCILLDPDEAARLPECVRERGRLEEQYARLLAELQARLDPQPYNPWPHHSTASGASLAVTLRAYRQIGGLPALPLGEDKALVASLVDCDARVRHALAVQVVTSGRLDGRAAVALPIRSGFAAPIRMPVATRRWSRSRLRFGGAYGAGAFASSMMMGVWEISPPGRPAWAYRGDVPPPSPVRATSAPPGDRSSKRAVCSAGGGSGPASCRDRSAGRNGRSVCCEGPTRLAPSQQVEPVGFRSLLPDHPQEWTCRGDEGLGSCIAGKGVVRRPGPVHEQYLAAVLQST